MEKKKSCWSFYLLRQNKRDKKYDKYFLTKLKIYVLHADTRSYTNPVLSQGCRF